MNSLLEKWKEEADDIDRLSEIAKSKNNWEDYFIRQAECVRLRQCIMELKQQLEL
jgi:uncharacterized ferredoxin-like protein